MTSTRETQSRIARPGELGEAIAFVLSGHAPFVTGTEIVVDAGRLAALPARLTEF